VYHHVGLLRGFMSIAAFHFSVTLSDGKNSDAYIL
jgi:hypothetical protein